MASYEEGSLKSCFNGAQLHCRYWKPEHTPKAIVFIAHGLAEHCGRYVELAIRLQQENFYAFAHDHVGHGRSEGSRIYVDTFESYANDVFEHFEKLKHQVSDDCPKFIVGHSMGGTIAIKCGLMRPDFFRGLVLISPGLAPNPRDASFIKVTLGKWLSRIAPNFPVHYIDPKLITTNTARVKEFVEDELCYHGWVKAIWAIAILQATQEFEKSVKEFSVPFLLLQGDEDLITLARFAKEFHSKAGSKDKSLKMYENVYHNLLHEVDDVRLSTESDVIGWLNERLALRS